MTSPAGACAARLHEEPSQTTAERKFGSERLSKPSVYCLVEWTSALLTAPIDGHAHNANRLVRFASPSISHQELRSFRPPPSQSSFTSALIYYHTLREAMGLLSPCNCVN